MKKAKLTFEGKAIELDVIVGSENEIGIDVCLIGGKAVKGILGTRLPPNKDHPVKNLIA